MSSFVVSSLKKNENEEVKNKNDVMALHPRHIENWVSLFALNLKDLDLKLMFLSM